MQFIDRQAPRRRLARSATAYLATLVLPFALATAGSPEPAPDPALAGLWESAPSVATGSALWLSPAGDVLWGSLMTVDGTYEVRGDRLTTRWKSLETQGEAGPDPASPIGALTKSTWTRESPEGTQRRERVGASEDVTVKGVWKFMHTLGRTAYERYGPKDEIESRMQVGAGIGGTWSRVGDAVKIQWADSTQSTLRVDGPSLRSSAAAFGDVAYTRRAADNWYALALAPVVFSEGLKPSSDADVVGLWESTHTSLGGISAAYWIDPSGRVDSATVVIVGGTYEVNGTKLIRRAAEKQGTTTDESDLGEVTATTWRQVVQGNPMVKERVGLSTGQGRSIIGVWRELSSTGGIANERYEGNGAFQFRMRLIAGDVGTWSRKGDQVEMRWAADSPRRLTLRKEALLQVDAKGQEHRLERRGKEDWYALTGPMAPSPPRDP